MLPEISEALRAVDIIDAFPIQEMALPIALMGTDLIGQARTGTGKTLAFAIPVLQRVIAPHDPDFDELAAPNKPQALIVTPTRELALQVENDIVIAGAKRGCRSITVYGGVAYEPQLDALREGVEIVVGTPGRLLDLAQQGHLDLGHVRALVLDEADEMLDLGFLPDVEKLISKTPELRQTMLFSATMRGEVVTLARTHMRHPVNVRAEASSEAEIVPTTAQFVYQTHDLDKPEILARLMQAEGRGLSIVFTRTKRQAQRVAEDLIDRGFPAAPLHGDMAQIARERAMKRFREAKVEILVATDVAARGIDVEGITHVVNYSCPEDEKTYVHRIGRTGRAGASGIAVTFVDWADMTRWKVINNALGLPYAEPAETYSTSEHLFHDHGIPHDTQGRIGPPKPAKRASDGDDRESRPPRSRPEGSGARPKRQRSRRRTRNGQPAGDAPARDATAEAASSAVGGDSRDSGDSGGSGDRATTGSGRSRSRNRRRRSPSTKSDVGGQ